MAHGRGRRIDGSPANRLAMVAELFPWKRALARRRWRAQAQPRHRAEFRLESLEARVLLATFNPLPSAVDGAEDSLRAAIIASNTNGEDDTIELATAEYLLTASGREEDLGATGDLDVREQGSTLIIRGKGIDLTIINANFLDRVLEVHSNATLILQDLTIRNGEVADENGAGLRNLGDATLRNVKVFNNLQTGSSSQAPRGGGGVNSQGDMLIEGGIIAGNIAAGTLGGGGIYNTGHLTVRGGTIIEGNQANRDGGGIRIAFRTTHIEDAIIRNNTGINDGGGIFVVNDEDVIVTLDRVQIIDNETGTDGRGGGIRNGGTLTIHNSTIEGNSAPGGSARGGGIYHGNSGSNLSIMTSSIIDNASDLGGGVYITDEATFDITRSLIANNTVTDDGAGLWNGSQSSGTIANTTVSGNQATRGGGGIYNFGELTVTNTTITNNRADKDGPRNGNIYSSGGGIKGGSDPTLTLHNTIIAGNYSGTGSTAFFQSDLNSRTETVSSYNITGDALINSDASNVVVGFSNAGLGPLADNGGPTLTHALTPGSEAVNAGNPDFTPFKDQRGLPMNDVVDVGAYELQQAYFNEWAYEVMEAGMFGSTNAGYGFGFDDLRRNSRDADPYFLGFKFDTGPMVVGEIVEGLVGDHYGAELRADLKGRLGFEMGFYIDSGDVFTKYDGKLNYIVDDLGGGEFNVSTIFGVDDGTLGTVSPQIGAYLDLVLELDADISVTACAVGCVTASMPFKIDESLEIFSINRQETDASGNPMYEADGGPMFDQEVRFAKESIFIETNDGTGKKEAKKYAEAKGKEDQGKFAEAFAKDDLANAKTDEQREKAQERIKDAQEKQADAVEDQGKAAKQAKKNKELGQQGITLDFKKAEGDLLGFEVDVIGEIGKDKVASRQIDLGGFTVTVPEVELDSDEMDYLGRISATTDDITDPAEDAKRQLARMDLDIGGLLGTYAGLPTGKQKVDIGGIASVEVQTVSYTISPQLNVTQDVLSTPYATMVHYELSRPAEVNLGDGFQTMTSFDIAPEQTFRIRPGDEPIDVSTSLMIANKFTNQIGLDLDLKGALEAFALEVEVLGETLIDLGPLITHNHTFGSFELGNVFDRTFDLAVFDEDTGERFEDSEGTPIVFGAPLDGFTIMAAEANGTSPGTAFRAVQDESNPDLLRVEGVTVENLGMPVFVKVPLIDAGSMSIADRVNIMFGDNGADSAYTLDEGIIIDNFVPPGDVVQTPMVDATLWEFDPKSALDVSNLLEAGVTELVIGFMFEETGPVDLTFTRSDYAPLMDVPVDAIGGEGVDVETIDLISPEAILQSVFIDVDGNGQTSPLSDGVMVIRYLDGVRGDALVAGALGEGATRTAPAEIEAFIADQLANILDVDDDGEQDAQTDGLLIARQLAGFAGNSLTEGAVNPQGARLDPDEIDVFLRGEQITTSNDPVTGVLRDEAGNIIPQVPGGTGFEGGGIVSLKGGDPFVLHPQITPGENSATGASAAKPVTPMAAPALSALSGALQLPLTAGALMFDLSTYGQTVTYVDLFKADASDPDNEALWQLIDTMAEGAPMPFADLGVDLTDASALREMSALLRKQERTNVLGVDEPVFIEVPDAAGYEYEVGGGYAFDSIQIDPDFGDNLLIDRDFDLYLLQDSQWVYDRTITAGVPHMFDAPVESFRLFGLALPNAQLHRAANDAAPTLLTTTGFTLAVTGATGGLSPMVGVDELQPREKLSTPEDFLTPRCLEGENCGNAFGEDAEMRLVRNGPIAELYLNDEATPRMVYQLSSVTDTTVIGDHHQDVLTVDLSGGPIRPPLVFDGGEGGNLAEPDGLIINGSGYVLDLMDRDTVSNVETLNIMGDGSNTLRMDFAAVQRLNPLGGVLTLVGDADDVADVGDGWDFMQVDGDGMHVFSQEGITLKTSAALAPQVGGAAPLTLPLVSEPAANDDAAPTAAAYSVVTQTGPLALAGDVQTITVSPANPEGFIGGAVSFDVVYQSTASTSATGLALRMHYDSTRLTFDGASNVLAEGSFTQQVQAEGTNGIADDDSSTDMFVNLLWLDAGGDWPTAQPATLFTANFLPVGDATGDTTINFTGEAAPGFDAVTGEDVIVTVSLEPPLTASIDDISITEGDAGQSNAQFIVSLSKADVVDVTLDYTTVADTAQAGTDFIATSGQLVIPAGQTAGVINVPVLGDTSQEHDELFAVLLSNPVNVAILKERGEATILNDDLPAVNVQRDTDAAEADELPGGFRVTRDGLLDDPLTVHYSVAGSATADADYATLSGEVVIPAGQAAAEFSVVPIDDEELDSAETVVVTISDDAGYVVAAPSSATVTIVDDEVPSFDVLLPDDRGRLTFTDAGGNEVTISFKGDGAFEAQRPGGSGDADNPADVVAIVLTGTGEKSSLSIKGSTTIGSIVADGPLKDIKGKGVTLAGDVTLDGSLGKVDLAAVVGPATFSFGGAASDKGMSFKAPSVRDLSIMTSGKIKSLAANEWLNTDDMADTIHAPIVDKVSIKGDMEASINATSSDNAIKSISVAGWLDGAAIRTPGSVGSVKLGGMRDSSLLLGTRSDLQGMPAQAGDFVTQASLKSLKVSGKSSDGGDSFLNSIVAAWSLGKVSLGEVRTLNEGIDFGIAGSSISKVDYSDNNAKYKSPKDIGVGDFHRRDDLVLRVIA